MSIKPRQLTVDGLAIDVVRKDIKHLHLAVYPPAGKVRVAVPLRMSDDAVRLAVITRRGWIERQQRKFAGQERQSPRQYVTGESHYFQGHRYRLNVVWRRGPAEVAIRNSRTVDLFIPEGSDFARRERVFRAWYRRQLKAQIGLLIEKWEAVIGVHLVGWGVKQMKTKWASCTVEDRRIWLNLELAKKPVACLEYVVVHEMVHLLERPHNDRFRTHLDRFLPQWRLHHEALNSAPLILEPCSAAASKSPLTVRTNST